jgi:hypothetical protein
MTISSKFSSNIEQMVSDKKIFMGISHRVLHSSNSSMLN